MQPLDKGWISWSLLKKLLFIWLKNILTYAWLIICRLTLSNWNALFFLYNLSNGIQPITWLNSCLVWSNKDQILTKNHLYIVFMSFCHIKNLPLRSNLSFVWLTLFKDHLHSSSGLETVHPQSPWLKSHLLKTVLSPKTDI